MRERRGATRRMLASESELVENREGTVYIWFINRTGDLQGRGFQCQPVGRRVCSRRLRCGCTAAATAAPTGRFAQEIPPPDSVVEALLLALSVAVANDYLS